MDGMNWLWLSLITGGSAWVGYALTAARAKPTVPAPHTDPTPKQKTPPPVEAVQAYARAKAAKERAREEAKAAVAMMEIKGVIPLTASSEEQKRVNNGFKAQYRAVDAAQRASEAAGNAYDAKEDHDVAAARAAADRAVAAADEATQARIFIQGL